MLYHAGLLDAGRSPLLARIKTQRWSTIGDELDIALLTPGFTVQWWARQLGRSASLIQPHIENISESLRPQAIANWDSITREDCIKLAQFEGHKPIPVLIQIATDRSNGIPFATVMKTYSCSRMLIERAVKRPLLSSYTIPDWFRARIPGA